MFFRIYITRPGGWQVERTTLGAEAIARRWASKEAVYCVEAADDKAARHTLLGHLIAHPSDQDAPRWTYRGRYNVPVLIAGTQPQEGRDAA